MAVLEVEDFENAVNLSAQTGLRDAIGKHELADMLSHRDRLGKEIQQVLDAKTSAWGITIQSLEIRDINYSYHWLCPQAYTHRHPPALNSYPPDREQLL